MANDQKQPPQPPGAREGIESEMKPRPRSDDPGYHGSGKLKNKIALITGGDSGIGRAVAIAYAKEGANIAIVYHEHHSDAEETMDAVKQQGRSCMKMDGDVGDEDYCRHVIQKTVSQFGGLDILVNNAAEQHPQDSIEKITSQQLEQTFRTNVFAQFYLIKAALPHLKEGGVIINTTSVTAYKGHPQLLDYSASKGAIVALTRSLSLALIKKGIRVNGVAPGPIWTPLIASTFPDEKIKHFGESAPMNRAGQPEEIAPCFVFLASNDASYMAGQILHPNGGIVVNG